MDWVVPMFGLFFFASLIASYNMGWQNGHDVHHDDTMHRRRPNIKPPDRSLYV